MEQDLKDILEKQIETREHWDKTYNDQLVILQNQVTQVKAMIAKNKAELTDFKAKLAKEK